MSPPTMLEPSERQRARSWLRRKRPLRGVSGAALVAVLLALGQMIDQPRFVSRVHIVNTTAYDLDVEVTNADHDGWMPMWTAARSSTTIAEEIYDIGDAWIFRFSAQGETTGELRVERAELERNSWTLSIPTHIGDDLREKGALPPP